MNREEKVSARRAGIVEAALGCFLHQGFHQASMRDIAGAAGVSLGNLYNHFPSKEALITEIARMESAELEPMLAALEQEAPLDALLGFARSYLHWCSSVENAILTSEVIAEAARRPDLAQLFALNRKQLCKALADTIRRGVQDGTVDGTIPPAALADVLLDAIEGHALRAMLFTPPAGGAKALLPILRKLLTP